jgi:hypothetical protein
MVDISNIYIEGSSDKQAESFNICSYTDGVYLTYSKRHFENGILLDMTSNVSEPHALGDIDGRSIVQTNIT